MTAAPGTSAAAFAARWRENARREHASSQGHCIDLCRLLGVPTPNEAGPTGDWYTFEAGAPTSGSASTSAGSTRALEGGATGHSSSDAPGGPSPPAS